MLSNKSSPALTNPNWKETMSRQACRKSITYVLDLPIESSRFQIALRFAKNSYKISVFWRIFIVFFTVIFACFQSWRTQVEVICDEFLSAELFIFAAEPDTTITVTRNFPFSSKMMPLKQDKEGKVEENRENHKISLLDHGERTLSIGVQLLNERNYRVLQVFIDIRSCYRCTSEGQLNFLPRR
jgi:hypothetical protein